MSNELTLADHAELWLAEQGIVIPDRGTTEWRTLYEKWVEFAFTVEGSMYYGNRR